MTVSRPQLGSIIRTAREARGLSLRETARRLELDPSYYQKIESGQHPLGKHARAVAKLLKLNAADLEAMALAKLPTLAPYLRAKYDLPAEAIVELESHFAAVSAQYKRRSSRSISSNGNSGTGKSSRGKS